MIKDLDHARAFSIRFKNLPTLVVTENGDIIANRNLEDICQELDAKEEKYFIVNGERKEKKVKKNDK